MTKIAGSGSATGYESISQGHGSAGPDPDPHQNVMDPEHCCMDTRTNETSASNTKNSYANLDALNPPPDARFPYLLTKSCAILMCLLTYGYQD
jgi:hypothetical protein